MPINIPVVRTRWRILLKLLVLVLLIIAANFVSSWIVDSLHVEIRPSNEDFVHRVLVTAAVAHALLIAIPFVPGVEVGITLIAMMGPAIVMLVYVSTVVGLLLSFVVGRLVSLKLLANLFEDLSLHRASRLISAIEPMDRTERLNYLVSKAPNRLVPFLLRHRYLALAILINVPGNVVIGGGGGIALLAGASKLYSLPGYLATIALAVSPVPIAVLIFGKNVLSG
jgi:hypothetical protein